jgi:hypothetical protein
MQSDNPLRLYGEIRSTLDVIHELAVAIERELARLQIHREQEAIPRALDHLRELAAKITALESCFSVCSSPRRSAAAQQIEVITEQTL